MIDAEKYKSKNYVESRETLKWLEENVPSMKQSEFIRIAVAERIETLSTGKSKIN